MHETGNETDEGLFQVITNCVKTNFRTEKILKSTMQSILSFETPILPLEKMKAILSKVRKDYALAKPFPHIVFDDFFNEEVVERVLEEFPDVNEIEWIGYHDKHQKKLANEHEENIGLFTRYVLYSLNSQVFLQFLEELSGIPALISDPTFRGAGLHNIPPGGKLGLHLDFNKHKKYNLDRRLNFLLYLNKNWQDEYNGHVELWDNDLTKCYQRVAPIFNRVVIFTTSDHSWHGHPDPLNCPKHMSRKSLALYFYTHGRPATDGEDIKHSTLWKFKPGEKIEGNLKIRTKKVFDRLSKKFK